MDLQDQIKVSLEESSVSECTKSESPMNLLMTGNVSNPAADGLQSDLVCPVCSSRKYKDETSLSSHVEECLNKQTIAELLRADSHNTAVASRRTLLPAPSKKRKSSQSEKKTLKKSRSDFTKPIDSYFKLKS